MNVIVSSMEVLHSLPSHMAGQRCSARRYYDVHLATRMLTVSADGHTEGRGHTVDAHVELAAAHRVGADAELAAGRRPDDPRAARCEGAVDELLHALLVGVLVVDLGKVRGELVAWRGEEGVLVSHVWVADTAGGRWLRRQDHAWAQPDDLERRWEKCIERFKQERAAKGHASVE